MQDEDQVAIYTRVDPGVAERLRAIASDQDRSVSAEVRRLIERHVADHPAVIAAELEREAA